MRFFKFMTLLLFISLNICGEKRLSEVVEEEMEACSIEEAFSPMDVSARLDRHVEFLYLLDQKNKSIWRFLPSKFIRKYAARSLYLNLIDFDGVVSFLHDKVSSCVNKINRKNDLSKFFVLWKKFKRKEVSDEKLFLKEFSVLVAMIYTSVWQNFSETDTTRFSFSNIKDIYQKTSDLPILKLLDLLDEFLDQFELLVEESGIEDASWSTWKKWLVKKGLAFVVIVVAVAIKVLTRGSSSGYGGCHNSGGPYYYPGGNKYENGSVDDLFRRGGQPEMAEKIKL